MVLALAIAMRHENIMGAIQWTCGGPRLVHANPKRPIDKRGATIAVSGRAWGIKVDHQENAPHSNQ